MIWLCDVAFAVTAPPASSLGVTLTVEQLRYDTTILFQNFTLSLPAASWTCLLGPSGVGKSSLLRILAGLAPDGSRYHITPSDGAPLAGRVAYMAQQDLLLPWLSARDNVLLGATLRRQAVDPSRADHLLESVGLAEVRHQRPDQLSGGQRQRVALARTLLEECPLVLMDEPFSALDPITRIQMQDLAAELLTDRTVLLVTHDPLEALRLGDHVLVLRGQPATATEQPLPPQWLTPRAVDDPRLAALHGALLARLSLPGAAP